MKPGEGLGELWTPDETAAWLKVRPAQLARLGIPQFAVTRKMVRYRPEDVQAWLEGFKRDGGKAA